MPWIKDENGMFATNQLVTNSMHRYFLLLFGLFAFYIHGLAVTIHGTVTGNRKQALPDVIVELSSADNKHVLGNTQTDSKGCFRLDYFGKADSLQLRILGFNIEKQARLISAHEQEVTLQAVEKDIRIREVVVHTKQIWRTRDTVNYLVSRFTKYEDQTIGDVLRKLPWITVDGNGFIHYLEKPINRFTIEGVDLQRNRFGLATTLLKPQEVYIIQVFKKRTVLKKRRVVQIAINLRMK